MRCGTLLFKYLYRAAQQSVLRGSVKRTEAHNSLLESLDADGEILGHVALFNSIYTDFLERLSERHKILVL